MPLYDYKCKKCGYLFEVEQRMSDKKLEFCPKCKGPVERLIAPVGIIFKGSGFYVTDKATTAPDPQPAKTATPNSSPEKTAAPAPVPAKAGPADKK